MTEYVVTERPDREPTHPGVILAEALRAMGSCARTMAVPGAAGRIAERVLAVAGGV